MYHIIISSHGNLSNGFLDTLKYFKKEVPNIHSIILGDKSVYDYQEEVRTLIASLEGEILVLVDLFQGTPFKTFFLELHGKQDAVIISNIAFPQVLTAAVMQESRLSEAVPLIEHASEVTVTSCSSIVSLATEEDE